MAVIRETPVSVREEQGAIAAPQKRSLWPRLFSGKARPIRFFLVGQTATLTQLCVLYALTSLGWLPGVANAVALILSSQVNFFLSATFTWRDRDALERRGERSRGTALIILGRWARFMSGIAVTTLLNDGLFILLERTALPVLVAAIISSGVIAVLNYLMIDLLIFRRKRRNASAPA
jgi:putative flippase GtrA